MATEHVPVLAAELLELTDPRPGDVVVDCTFGAGGHARLMAERIGPDGLLIAIDRDPHAEERFEEVAREVSCAARFIGTSFAAALELLHDEGLRADVVYLDLGISSMQIDVAERGFSYVAQAPLDMRMDPRQDLSAADIVAGWDDRRLARLLREYGEERYAGPIARAIVREREKCPIETTTDLVEVVTAAIPAPARFAGGHPAKRVFQAIRIAVNDELGEIDAALPLAWDILRENGRFAGMSFQSLEDRRVKRFLAGLARGCICPPGMPVCRCGRTPQAELLVRGGVVPTDAEATENPRARSARLRAARKLSSEGAPA